MQQAYDVYGGLGVQIHDSLKTVREKYGAFDVIRAEITSKLLLQAIDYWASIARDGALPRRCDFDPMANPKLLPTTFMVSAKADGSFRYQLAGSLIEEKFGVGSVRDKTPEELMGDAAQNVLAPYCRVRDEGIMFYREGSLEWVNDNQRYSHYCVLLMPLSDDGHIVTTILGVQDFIRSSDR